MFSGAFFSSTLRTPNETYWHRLVIGRERDNVKSAKTLGFSMILALDKGRKGQNHADTQDTSSADRAVGGST